MDSQLRRTSLNVKDLPVTPGMSLLGKNWYEAYLGYLKGLIAFDPYAFYLDVLKDLYEDFVPDNVVVHLLALLEANVFAFGSREDM